ncbi:MAG TPA: DedA family protein [Acidimicrobiales bacterium]|nr:DedA family protein [Acidimicrobiales bacterium]
MSADHLVSSYGYWAVFVLVGLESIGIPLPGETILIVASTLAGKYHHLSVWGIFAAASAGAIIGDNIGFWVGDKGGYRLLRRFGKYIHLDEGKLKVGRYIFDRHGGKVVFFGRFVSVLRTYAAFLAGTNKMRWRAFLVFNAAGGILWSGIYSFAAYYAGDSLRHASGKIDIIIGAIAVVVIVGVFLFIRHQGGKLQERAEAAYPGPLA